VGVGAFSGKGVDPDWPAGIGGEFVDEVFSGLPVNGKFEGVGGEAIGSGLGMGRDGTGGFGTNGADGFDGGGAVGFKSVGADGRDSAEAGTGGLAAIELGVGRIRGVDLLAGDDITIEVAGGGGRFEVGGPGLAV